MIPSLQSASSWSTPQRQTEIDPIKRNAKALEAQAAFSATAVSNTLEQPTTASILRKISHEERLKKASSQLTEQSQRDALFFLINVMLGLETFEYDESKVEWVRYHRKEEKYNIRTLLATAFQAETALFNLKTFIATFTELKNASKATKMIKSARKSMRLALKTFISIGMEYCSILDRLSKQGQPELVAGLTDGQISYAMAKMTTAKKMRNEAKDKCKCKFIEVELDEARITEELGVFIRKNLVRSVLENVSSRELKNVVQTYLDTQIDTQRLPQLSKLASVAKNLPASAAEVEREEVPEEAMPNEVSPNKMPNKVSSSESVIMDSFLSDRVDIACICEELEFKEDRAYVNKSFWDAFETSLTPSECLAKFYQFLLTNWLHEPRYKQELKQHFTKIRVNQQTTEEYHMLLKSHFQKNIQFNAAAFIKNVVRIKDYQAKIAFDKNQIDERERINYQNAQEVSFNHLKNIICNNIHEAYLNYKTEKNNALLLSETKLKEKILLLFKERDRIRKGASYEQKKFNLNSIYNLQYINQALHVIRNESDFDEKKIINLARFFLAQEKRLVQEKRSSPTQITPMRKKSLHENAQIDSEPPAKKMAIVVDVTGKTPSPPRLHFSEPHAEHPEPEEENIAEENIVTEEDRDLLLFMEQRFPQISNQDIAEMALQEERVDLENRQNVALLEGMDDIIAEYWEKQEQTSEGSHLSSQALVHAHEKNLSS